MISIVLVYFTYVTHCLGKLLRMGGKSQFGVVKLFSCLRHEQLKDLEVLLQSSEFINASFKRCK